MMDTKLFINKASICLLLIVFGAGFLSVTKSTHAADKKITIGYQNLYNPWKVAIVDGAFEKATGYQITWRQFTSGFKTLKPLAKGQIQMTVAGSSPIAAAASSGLDIELFWIVEDIGAGEALVVRNGSGIKAPRDLIGKKLAVPIGSTSHFHALFALEQFGIGRKDIKLFNMQPNSISSAWKSKSIDAAFIWDPVLSQIERTGKVLITSGQLSRWGKATFDGMVVDRKWARNNPDFMLKFVQTIAAADKAYTKDRRAWTARSEPVKKIAKLVGGKVTDIPRSLFLYKFPSLADQVSARWLGGGSKSGAARALYHTSKFLLEQKKIKRILPDYGKIVNNLWVRRALAQ